MGNNEMKIFSTRRLKLTATGLVAGVLISLLAVGMNAPPCASASSPTCPTPADRDFSGKLGIQSNTPYTTTLSAAATADQIITLPDADTSLVGATSTDTLENKTIDFTLNTGSNYAVGNLSGTTLSPLILNSSLTSTGVLSSFDIGSAGTTLTQSATYGAGDVEIEGNVIYRDDGVTIPIDDGGTGTATLTLNGLIANGTSQLTGIAMGTKGQLLVGDASGLPQALPVGADGDQLSADPAEVTGLKWASAGGGGSTNASRWYWDNGGVNGQYSGWTYWSGANTPTWGVSPNVPPKGTAMGVPSTIYDSKFTFPSTGTWMVRVKQMFGPFAYTPNYHYDIGLKMYQSSNNGGSWNEITYDYQSVRTNGYAYVARGTYFYYTVTDTANDVIRWEIFSYYGINGSGGTAMQGDWYSQFEFVRLGN